MGKDNIIKPVKSTANASIEIKKKRLMIALVVLVVIIVIAVTAVVIVLLKKKPTSGSAETESNVVEFSQDWSSYSTQSAYVDSSDYKLPLTGDTGNEKAEPFPDKLPLVE